MFLHQCLTTLVMGGNGPSRPGGNSGVYGLGFIVGFRGLGFTHRPLSSSFLGLPYRVLNINHKKELLRSLWVGFKVQD